MYLNLLLSLSLRRVIKSPYIYDDTTNDSTLPEVIVSRNTCDTRLKVPHDLNRNMSV